jgi:hypothetical protein
MRRRNMKMSGFASMAAVCICLFSYPAYPEDASRANELGEDFQRQIPGYKEKPQGGETPGQTQPQDYTAPPDREKPEPQTTPQGTDYPLCYNPYTRVYEYCHPEDTDSFRLRLRSPDFRFWWERGRSCPPGYYFKPGWGCYRY